MEIIQPKHPEKLPENLRQWVREMRVGMTDAEALLWKMLRNRRIASAKFRRQHPIGNFILDFYCPEKKLCVELDGGQHVEAMNYDKQCDAWLNARGIRVLRFWNDQVLRETEDVLEVIYFELTTLSI
jgi:adenine-specific DNA-methyltransferase